jgi:Flp pilus assembly protein TadG
MSRKLRPLRGFLADRRGATAVEYAFILPVFVMMIFGVIGVSQLAGAMSSMHYAVEEASRCFAVNKTTCGTPTTAAAYANAKYLGPDVGVVFVATNTGCGFTVSATATYTLQLAVSTLDVPLSAAACYPGKLT